MSAFQGRWTSVKGSGEGFDEIMDFLGLSDKLKNAYRDLVYTLDYVIDGPSSWKVTAIVEGHPDRKTNITVGEPYTTVALTGEPVEAVLTVISNNEVSEAHKATVEGKQIESSVVRSVDGDIMTVVATAGGKKYTYKMKKH